MSRHITNTVAEMVSTALSEGGYDEIDYDVSMALVPGPQGQPQAVVAITFTLGAVVVGENHSGTVAIPPAIPAADSITDLVTNVCRGLREQRSQQAAQQMAQANGHKPEGASGLILPS